MGCGWVAGGRFGLCEVEDVEDDEDDDFNDQTAFTVPRGQDDDEDEDDLDNYSDNDVEEIEEIVRPSLLRTFTRIFANHSDKGSRRRRFEDPRCATSIECW